MLESEGHPERYLLGFEESYGYLSGGYVRDKDAVDGSMIICEMASYYKEKGMTLVDAIMFCTKSMATTRMPCATSRLRAKTA